MFVPAIKNAAACNLLNTILDYEEQKKKTTSICLDKLISSLWTYEAANGTCPVNNDTVCNILAEAKSDCSAPNIQCSITAQVEPRSEDRYVFVYNKVDGTKRAVFEPLTNFVIQTVRYYVIYSDSPYLLPDFGVPSGKTVFQSNLAVRAFKVGLSVNIPRANTYINHITLKRTKPDGSVDNSYFPPLSGLPTVPYIGPSVTCPLCYPINPPELQLDHPNIGFTITKLIENYFKYYGVSTSAYHPEVIVTSDTVQVIFYIRHLPNGVLYGLEKESNLIPIAQTAFLDGPNIILMPGTYETSVVVTPSTTIPAQSIHINGICSNLQYFTNAQHVNVDFSLAEFNNLKTPITYSNQVNLESPPTEQCPLYSICYKAFSTNGYNISIKNPANQLVLVTSEPAGCYKVPYNAAGNYTVTLNTDSVCTKQTTVNIPTHGNPG